MPGRSEPSEFNMHSSVWHQVDVLMTGVVFVLVGESPLDHRGRKGDRAFVSFLMLLSLMQAKARQFNTTD